MYIQGCRGGDGTGERRDVASLEHWLTYRDKFVQGPGDNHLRGVGILNKSMLAAYYQNTTC